MATPDCDGDVLLFILREQSRPAGCRAISLTPFPFPQLGVLYEPLEWLRHFANVAGWPIREDMLHLY